MDISKYFLIYFIYLCFISILGMAKRNTERNTKTDSTKPEKKKKLITLNETWQAILSGAGLIGIGFGIGLWVANQEKNDAIRQRDLDCDKRIEAAKKEWDNDKKNELFLEALTKIISNPIIKNKNENK